MLALAIIFLSFFIGAVYILFLRSFDIYERDPFIKLFISFLAGGLVAVILSLSIYSFVDVRYNFLDAIIKIGLIEEGSKFLSFLLIFRIFRKDINEIVDGVLYISMISLGFACIENVFYAMADTEPFTLIIKRALTSVAGHISFSGYMGIATFIHFRRYPNKSGILFSIILAVLAHGLYDGFLFTGYLVYFFQFLFIALIAAHLFLIRLTMHMSLYRPGFTPSLFTGTGEMRKVSCLECESDSQGEEISFRHILITRCASCGSFNIGKKDWNRLLNYFAPMLRQGRFYREARRIRALKIPAGLEGEGNLLFNEGVDRFCAEENNLATWLRDKNDTYFKRALTLPLTGWILKLLGVRQWNKRPDYPGKLQTDAPVKKH